METNTCARVRVCVLMLACVLACVRDAHAQWQAASYYKGAFKKTAGVAHTANVNDPPNESIPSQVSIALNQVMGQAIPGTPPSCDPQDAVDLGIVEYLECDLDLVSGSDNKAYELAFPDTYSGFFGTGVQGDPIRDSTFVVPLSYNTSYSQSDHNGGFAPDLYDNAVRVPATSSKNWWLDPYAGVITSETDLSLSTTGTVRIYLYTGALLSDNVKLNNYVATVDPTSNDDEDDGYDYGSIWLNNNTDEVFFCVLPTAASALWVSLIGSGSCPTAAEIADAVWDELRSGHTTSGSFGEGVIIISIGADAINAAAIAADAIGSSELATNAITSDEVATSAIAKWVNTDTGEVSVTAGSVADFSKADVSDLSVQNVAESRTLTRGSETNSYTDTQTKNNTFYQVKDIGVAATGTLTLTANAANDETVTLDTKVYTFKDTLTDTDCYVKVGTDAEESLDNLVAAITLGSGVGTVYAASCTLHPTVTAVDGTGTTVDVTAKVRGTDGNSIATTETLANGSFGGGTLSGGVQPDIDVYLQFDCGIDRQADGIFIHGRLDDNNGALDAVLEVYAYNWADAGWEAALGADQIATATDIDREWFLGPEHVGDYGANQGKVRVRFYSDSCLKDDELLIDYAALVSSKAGTGRSLKQVGNVVWNWDPRELTEPVDLSLDAVDDIWDENSTPHVTANTFGKFVKDIETHTSAMYPKLPSGIISDFNEANNPVELLNSGGAAGTAADELVDDVWEELIASHTTAGTFGLQLGTDVDAILTDTTDIASVKTTVEATNAEVTHATYGLDQLVRSTTPANTLSVDSSNRAAVDVQEVSGDATAADNFETMLDGTGGKALSLSRLVISSTGNDTAVDISAAGTGAAIQLTASATGPTVKADSNSSLPVFDLNATNGNNVIDIDVTGGAGNAVNIDSLAGSTAIAIAGGNYGMFIGGVGTGMSIQSIDDGHGLYVVGEGTGKHAIALAQTDTGDPAIAWPGATTLQIEGNLTGSVDSVTDPVTTDTASRDASKADVSNLDVAVSTRSSHAAADVWAVGTRTITGGTVDTATTCSNVATVSEIADGVWDESSSHGYAGTMGQVLNDAATDVITIKADTNEMQGKLPTGDLVDSTAVTSATTSALNSYDPPTYAELVARTIASASYFDPAVDAVANVTLVATTTTNTDMRGTDNAAIPGDEMALTAAERAAVRSGLALEATVQGLNDVSPSVVQSSCAAALTAYDPPTDTEMDAGFAGVSSHSAADVWAVGTRTITGGTITTNNDKSGYQIAGTKNILDDLNDISTAQAQQECQDALVVYDLDHLAAIDGGTWTPTIGTIFGDLLEDDVGAWRFSANALEEGPTGEGGGDCASQASVDDLPTVAEFEARTLPAADYLITSDTLNHVTSVGTCVVNSDMRGTNNASTHSASDVWDVSVRGLTQTVTTDAASREASKADVSGLATYDQVAALSFSTHDASDVWEYTTRGLTEEIDLGAVKGIPVTSVADFHADTTGLATQSDLSPLALEATVDALDFSTHTAADVWTVGTRSLTEEVDIGAVKGVGVSGVSDFRATGFSTHDENAVITALLARVIDGESYESTIEAIRAVLLGKSVRAEANIVDFYKDNGVDVKVRIEYTGPADRTITIYP